jgi:hypothetical protein
VLIIAGDSKDELLALMTPSPVSLPLGKNVSEAVFLILELEMSIVEVSPTANPVSETDNKELVALKIPPLVVVSSKEAYVDSSPSKVELSTTIPPINSDLLELNTEAATTLNPKNLLGSGESKLELDKDKLP